MTMFITIILVVTSGGDVYDGEVEDDVDDNIHIDGDVWWGLLVAKSDCHVWWP